MVVTSTRRKFCFAILLKGASMHRFLSVAFMSSAAFIAGSWPVHADVRIGFHAPTTGFAAADGASAQIAAELAVEDLNKAGGIAGEKVESHQLRRPGSAATINCYCQQAY
ncbi:ABC transporter substrate-binding protein [Rhizobium sp. 28DA2]|uniref:ABC transporter substrate-binding protein n=1 Tax=Rhizobium sp. 28DA2 TaxID=3035209 RepID=UPI0034E89C5D